MTFGLSIAERPGNKEQLWPCYNLPLLVPRFLEEGRWPNLEAKYKRVLVRVKVALACQQVQAEEAVVTPTLSNLKVRGKFPDDVLARVARSLMHHLYPVFISATNLTHVPL